MMLDPRDCVHGLSLRDQTNELTSQLIHAFTTSSADLTPIHIAHLNSDQIEVEPLLWVE
jgi:hypothetical protein